MIRRLLVFGLLGVVLILLSFVQDQDIPDIALWRKLYSSGDSKRWPKPHLDDDVKANFVDIGTLPNVQYPADNPFSKEKSALGKILFFDPRLSATKQLACASCHDPQLGWGDGKSVAHGHSRRVGKRNAMTLYNVGYYRSFFWDGRSSSLEAQVLFPLTDSVEMNTDHQVAVRHIQEIAGYAPLFQSAFGDSTVNILRIQQAIATFERGIRSYSSKFDRFVQGNKNAMTDEEVWGLHLFRTKARCINCHNTPLFSDNQFHNDGQTLYGTKQQDFGHYHISGKQEDIGAFRTPSLREITLTGPWMHHGNFPTLLDVVQLYNLGNPEPIQRSVTIDPKTRPIHSAKLKKLNLTNEEINAVLKFLGAISSSTQQRMMTPKLPE
ncbi:MULTISPECIES: cytochrome-c peroxidase [unclassified Sphingobacterium]|uniref:cytochrome-c peroxidase n=1 Tax=unclassified Sphingobacterium TaxID=2609468 RepID=UPI0025D0A108|nr:MULTISPECIES: cytochrome c peroxidase [unclassified Sphingobacterium]